MRKQTKLVAVLSATALLALGASMASFAATGWVEENGSWVFYDKNGDKASDEWQKSGDRWFFLDDSGEMATDQLIENNDNYYYVDEDGAMVTNKWISITNEDYDGEDDEPVNNWYYFQGNGKAYKGSDSGVSLKTINGKKYTFDDEGKMLYGWVNEDGERETGDDAWRDGTYYFGGENDGSMAIGWLELEITDTDASDDTSGFNADTAFTEEDQQRFFYFKTNGKKTKNEESQTINGKKYAFDNDGRMVAEWRMNAAPAKDVASDSGAIASMATADKSQSWRFYGTPEDGARVTKGWFQVVPAEFLNSSDYDDDEENWYYSDSNGKLVASEFKTISGKKYGFDEFGSMIDGLKYISVETKDKNKIVAVHDDDAYDTEEKFEAFANGGDHLDETAPDFNGTGDYTTFSFFFGDSSDGSIKTGSQNVDIDGDSYNFLFNKSGSSKGAGKHGIDNSKYFLQGKLLKADKEDKYSVVEVQKNDEDKILGLKLLTTDEFTNGTLTKDEVTSGGYNKYDDKNTYYSFLEEPTDKITGATKFEYQLVNTSGKIVDNKTNAKDGDDMMYDVKGGKILAVYEKN